MQKILLLGFTILLTLIIHPTQSFAHASLEGTTPSEGEVVKYGIDVVTFQFSSKIESGSKFTVEDQNGNQMGVTRIDIDETVMLGQLNEPLSTGTYTVTYEIISGDSHPVEGSYQFKVETADVDDSKDTSEQKETSDQSDEATNEKEQTSNATSERKVEDGLSPLVLGFSGVLVVAGVGLLFWMFRKKGNV
ncbi:copper resistance CopC family protein [Pseudalkalibacillus berkeleyi]|uniref:Copper resistance protein CopC n=1 Tax=Pseudalkalibacillus berkeleyi TaxID=1069813 RepID=A0ABS9H0S6_9BACL|nr:copper resistance CopC family protein [Pseudalkalibacillus berkeleyi]MCF6138597.1 copper resistance protein CopC [Pseudalkalibacillus berkeleyi]